MRHYYAGRYPEAIRELDKALDLDPDFAPGHWHRSWVYAQLGRHQEAIDDARKAFESSGGNPLYTITEAWALALKGAHAEARRLLAQLDEVEKTRYVSSYHLATVHAALGDKDKAFHRLHLANEQQDASRHYLKVDPRLIPLRGDPRFAPLVKRLGF